MQILIAGCGYIGCRMAELLRDEGHEVFGLSRSLEGIPEGVHPMAANLLSAESIVLPSEVDTLVFCPSSGGTHGDPDARKVYTEGLSNLHQAFLSNGRLPNQTVLVSTSGVFAEDRGGWVDETSPVKPARPSAAALLEAEELVIQLFERVSIARLSGIYGPGRHRLIDVVLKGHDAGRRAPQGWLNQVHRDDAARAVIHLLKPETPCGLFLVSDTCPAHRQEVIAWISSQLNKALPTRPDDAGQAGGNKRCSSRKLQETGFRFSFPSYLEGYGELISKLKQTFL